MSKKKKLHKKNKYITFVSFAFFCLGIFVSNIQAQKSKIVEGGIVSGASYSSTDFENINLTNGALNLGFPLASLKGRGSAGFTYSLSYNSKLWQVMTSPVFGQGGTITYQEFLADTPDGGWNDLDYYQLEIWNRNSGMDAPSGPCTNDQAWRRVYSWKVEIKAPGGIIMEFRPTGYSDIPPGGTASDGGYFNVYPNGSVTTVGPNCQTFVTQPTNAPMTYYSSDGSGIRLTIQSQGEAGFTWELSMPDGSKVTQTTTGQRITDHNGNYVERSAITLPDGTQASGWIDQVGRYIAKKRNTTTREDTYYQQGYNGELLTWKVKWKTIYVHKNYTTTCNSCGNERGPVINTTAEMSFDVVEKIELPAQLGGLAYSFEYYGKNVDDNTTSSGWGEVKSVTIPTEAKITYGFKLSNFDPNEEYSEILPGEINLNKLPISKNFGDMESPVRAVL
jgi:hypothetical protein